MERTFGGWRGKGSEISTKRLRMESRNKRLGGKGGRMENARKTETWKIGWKERRRLKAIK